VAYSLARLTDACYSTSINGPGHIYQEEEGGESRRDGEKRREARSAQGAGGEKGEGRKKKGRNGKEGRKGGRRNTSAQQ